MYMQKYVFIVLIVVLTLTVSLSCVFTKQNTSVEEPFTPYLRQQFRQRSRQFRLGLGKRGRQANAWFNRMMTRYGLGF